MADKLLTYGPLGLICLILIGACWVLYKDKKGSDAEMAGMRLAHAAELKQQRDDYEKRLEEWEARYTAKTESWMEKYHDVARRMTDVTESIMRRFQR